MQDGGQVFRCMNKVKQKQQKHKKIELMKSLFSPGYTVVNRSLIHLFQMAQGPE
jgi:hypothetical protein